jgi:hypothetical protein
LFAGESAIEREMVLDTFGLGVAAAFWSAPPWWPSASASPPRSCFTLRGGKA